MKTYQAPPKATWDLLSQRPQVIQADQAQFVKEVFDAVERRGDAAVSHFSELLDGSSRGAQKMTRTELEKLAKTVTDDELKLALRLARKNIETFHAARMPKEVDLETLRGVRCFTREVALERVGLYIPAGSAPLCSSLLMLAVPAILAGCNEIVMCSPPQIDGGIDPVIAWLALELGLTEVYALGGVQAIAAMSVGTDSLKKVDKIFGPGNAWVTAAKAYAQYRGTAIDMAAGPSEVLIVADGSCDPSWVAADLLAQAEHGPDSQVVLCVTDQAFAEQVLAQVESQLALLPRKGVASEALQSSFCVVMDDLESCMEFSNTYGPEHLILAVSKPEGLISLVKQAGSVFLGTRSPESAGDYASGPNHTLPTGGAVRASSGVSVSSFLKTITFQELTATGLEQLTPIVAAMARAEGLEAHARAMEIRSTVNAQTSVL